ncbi:MAG TPA: hypothetical protein PLE14_08490 [Anaerolineales bacterium]|nr:hypothetical protein [Anaerolineales bacterium]HNO31004.1 hypothetical protein [Anaerolineales bacterium]
MNKRTLKNDFLELEYFTHSLRISRLTPTGKTNLLADMSHQPPIPTPYGDFYFRGGHRLWHAPEAMPRTYAPDTGELKITDLPNGVILETQTEPGSGIRKRIEIQLAPDKAAATLTHTLINDGLWPVELAPWTITQFRMGGTAVLPMPVGNVDTAGLLPNRNLSFWPYSRINDPRLSLRDDFILFKADSLPPFKMGYFNPQGWLAYWVDDVLFKKTFSVQTNLMYPDNNSNAEIYCNEEFVELESLSPLVKLDPGESTQHVETWEIEFDLAALPASLQNSLSATAGD